MIDNNDKTHELLRFLNTFDLEVSSFYRLYARSQGISETVLWVFIELLEYEDGLMQKQMAEMWGMPIQTINTCIQNLARQGLVSCTLAPNSRKNKIVALTEEGRRKAEKTVTPLRRLERNTLESFPMERLETVTNLMKDYLEVFKNGMEELLEQN